MSTNGNTATVYDYTRLAEIGKHRLTGYAGLENAGLEGEEQSVTTAKMQDRNLVLRFLVLTFGPLVPHIPHFCSSSH